jgi:hypothetical protein
LDALHAIPEFIAQIAGCARSPQCRDGLHLLLDCGAGTLDVVTFNVYRNPTEGEDRFPIFASAVERLGTHYLMAARLSSTSGSAHWDDIAEIPTVADLSDRLGLSAEQLAAADRKFSARVTSTVRTIAHRTRRSRTPLAEAWNSGVPVFVTGGGSYCSLYRDAVVRAFEDLRLPYKFTSFPAVEQLPSVLNHHMHRISVACGLTHDAELLGKIVPAHEIKDFVVKPKLAYRPDRDELYAK